METKRNIICSLLLIALLVFAVPADAGYVAADTGVRTFVAGGISYEVISEDPVNAQDPGAVNTVKVADDDANRNIKTERLVIPAQVVYGGVLYDVVRIEEDAFTMNEYIEVADLSEAVNLVDGGIGDFAFESCGNLKEVILPDTDPRFIVGERAFNGCKNLEYADLSSAVKLLRGAFSFCSGLKLIAIPDSGMDIHSSAFNSVGSLTVIPNGDTLYSHIAGMPTGSSSPVILYDAEPKYGETMSLSISTGQQDKLTYRWSMNGIDIEDSTNDTLTGIADEKSGGIYGCKISYGGSTFTARTGNIQIIGIPIPEPPVIKPINPGDKPSNSTGGQVVSSNKDTKLKKITIRNSVKRMKKGKSRKLTAVRAPKNATAGKVKWSSSNRRIMTVSKSGRIRAKKKGTVRITAKVGSVRTSVRIKVR